MDFREFGPGISGESYTVSLSLTVENASALWCAAAERALTAPGMTLADVLDTIGPREDPDIAECIAMLVVPTTVAGCGLDQVTVREMAQPAAAPVQLLPIGCDGAAMVASARLV
ncbi:hypothetical protein ACX40Y_16805 [Sphingomonas sp. RS6]